MLTAPAPPTLPRAAAALREQRAITHGDLVHHQTDQFHVLNQYTPLFQRLQCGDLKICSL